MMKWMLSPLNNIAIYYNRITEAVLGRAAAKSSSAHCRDL